jgi:uncharacterized membrane protein
VQTQVTGINNTDRTVGFWADANGDNFGFVEHDGHFTNVVDPNAPKPAPGTPSVEQLLGVDDFNLAAGFYTDANGNNHGFVYNINSNGFSPVVINGLTSLTATDINDLGQISGFGTTASGATEGFFDNHGQVTFLKGPSGASDVQALGLNNLGEIVGSYVDSQGNTDGFVYDARSGSYLSVVDPNAAPINGVKMTVVNGINDNNQLVGFYMDKAGNTDGMLVNVHHS